MSCWTIERAWLKKSTLNLQAVSQGRVEGWNGAGRGGLNVAMTLSRLNGFSGKGTAFPMQAPRVARLGVRLARATRAIQRLLKSLLRLRFRRALQSLGLRRVAPTPAALPNIRKGTQRLACHARPGRATLELRRLRR